jgi:hypothetical protein
VGGMRQAEARSELALRLRLGRRRVEVGWAAPVAESE